MYLTFVLIKRAVWWEPPSTKTFSNFNTSLLCRETTINKQWAWTYFVFRLGCDWEPHRRYCHLKCGWEHPSGEPQQWSWFELNRINLLAGAMGHDRQVPQQQAPETEIRNNWRWQLTIITEPEFLYLSVKLLVDALYYICCLTVCDFKRTC